MSRFLLLLILSCSVRVTTAQSFTLLSDMAATTEETISFGSSWGDYDGDGLVDLFVANASSVFDQYSVSDYLFRNLGEGAFERVTGVDAVKVTTPSQSAVWADYDQDGFLDLYVSTELTGGTSSTVNGLYRSSASSTLERVENSPAVVSRISVGSAWGDFNNDGDLDLFVPDNASGSNVLFENTSNGFIAVAGTPFASTGHFSRMGSWVDYDGDGDQDLYVVSFAYTNTSGNMTRLYRNNLVETGTAVFTENPDTQLTRDPAPLTVMGVNWVDYDNDGDQDAYLVAGPGPIINPLFRNEGNGVFVRDNAAGIVFSTGFTAGACWGDYDNDGDLDVFLGTKNQFNDTGRRNRYFVNDGSGVFSEVSTGDIVTGQNHANGCSNSDFDNDGDLDLFVPTGNNPSPNSGAVAEKNLLFRNDSGNSRHWINIRLIGTDSNRDAVGARISVTAEFGDKLQTQYRWISGGTTGDRGQNDRRVHLGLDDAVQIRELRIEWPSGRSEILANLAVDQFLVVTEGVDTASSSDPAVPVRLTLDPPFPNPFTGRTTIRYALEAAATVRMELFDLQGRLVISQTDGFRPAGPSSTELSATDLTPGVYFLRLSAGGSTASRSVILQR